MFKLEKISKTFEKGANPHYVLKNINLILPDKGLVSIVGESGSGKSTLLNLIALSEKPSQGNVRYNGRNTSKFSKKEIEEFRLFEMGMVFQHFNLLEDLDAFSNVLLTLEIEGVTEKDAKKKVEMLFKRFGMASLMKKKTSLLSGGEKQRVALLRAIINEPHVLLADEPTGALDGENEKLIMKELKKYSMSHLVIMVSHNRRIVDEYSDRIIEIKDGGIVSDSSILKEAVIENRRIKQRNEDKVWMWRFFWRDIKRDWKRNILTFLGSFVSTASLLLSLAFFSQSSLILDKEEKKTLLYTSATISKQETIPIENSPLSLTKSTRPELEEVKELFKGKDIDIECDFSYFLPQYTAYQLNGERKEPTSFFPISDIKLNDRSQKFIIEGRLPPRDSMEFVLVNKEFASQFDESLINHEIYISNTVRVEKDGVEDVVNLEYSFYISGVVEEFSFLNTPKVYYSSNAVKSVLFNTNLENISANCGENIDLLTFIEEEEGSSPYTNYEYQIFFSEDGARYIKELRKLDDKFVIKSVAFEISESFSNLMEAFRACIMPFLIIVLFGAVSITSFNTYSSFISKKKEIAILYSLGVRNEDVTNLTLSESILLSALPSLIALIACLSFSHIISEYVYQEVGIAGLFDVGLSCFGIPLFPALITIIMAFALPLFGIIAPQKFLANVSLSKELADE